MARVHYVVGAVLFGAFIALGIVVREAPVSLDRLLRDSVGTRWQGDLGTAAGVVSAVLGPPLPILLGAGLIIATLVLRRRGDPRAWVTLRVLVLLGACRLTSLLGKPVFARDRPRDYSDFSYPSGHVASVASTGFAAMVLCLWLAPKAVSAVGTAAVVATLLACSARVALGVHWITDTAGSILAVTGVGLLVAPALRLLPGPGPGGPRAGRENDRGRPG
ncbi:phosphatase PAP2 family protein [Saccharomonospora xinjiangensis]|uniref:Membrane-associated phospholipid phosphatase n=1 Tax=Saccharomonospora xinjiangensis XJ-54 TaxID=882086 RepID=I0UZ82_9PSEU|nr:phosphatase PAP2 family protein [Saccharomonospora xinjiangensis]EID53185.1 membrane-associated phospholipid phosphatase [Saccharomonospora xinjiangensis XJ-54]